MLRVGRRGARWLALFTALFVIAACGGGGGGGGGGVIPTGGPITVNGTVVDSANKPVSGANIILNNNNASIVTTGVSGAFSFDNVTPPYTLTVKAGTVIYEYRSISRANPQITTSGGVSNTAFLGGIVSGPASPLPVDQRVLIGATNGVFTTTQTTIDLDYGNPFSWTGNSTVTTDLAALHLSVNNSGIITSYAQMGKRTGVSLNNGVSQGGLNITLDSPVTTASTIFNYNLGAYNQGVATGHYHTLKVSGAQFFFIAPITSGTNVLLPSDGGTFEVSGEDFEGNGARRIGPAVLGGTTSIDLPSSTVLKNSLPANLATNVSKTPTLSWTPVNGVDMYAINVNAAGLRYTYIIPADRSSLTIADYTALGLPLTGNTTYEWDVSAIKYSGLSMDQLTDPATGGISELILFQANSMDLYDSAVTSFTTGT